jgi:hypothetical protein
MEEAWCFWYGAYTIQICDCSFIIYVSITRLKECSQDSVADIATGYRQDNRGVRVQVPVRSKMFSSPLLPDQF